MAKGFIRKFIDLLAGRIDDDDFEDDEYEYDEEQGDYFDDGYMKADIPEVERIDRSEVDMFAGVVIEYGKRLGIETPVNEFMLRRVREIEADY